ncbi:MAG: sigma-70 family RNA polymerase sigma factor [Bacteroidales bacterium]|nr:sigma-70 family RNA polymerase sigma factor [Bacteroidales bacterium]
MTKEQQFAQMVEEHKRTIFTVCYMFSNDRHQVDDLFQEILIKLWLGFDKFRKNSSLRTWVYRVSLNACLNLDRNGKRSVETVPLDLNINIFDEGVKDMEQVHQLYHIINQLGVIDRAFILLWLEGVSYDEIATIMGTNANNVGVRLLRIKEKLLQLSNQIAE